MKWANIQSIIKKSKNDGFTIVELLIVVVVISILATVTVVAYNGIQNRSKTIMYTATVDSFEKQIQMAIAKGELTRGYLGGVGTGGCVGETSDFPAISGLDAGVCYTHGGEPVTVNTELSTRLKDIGVSLPGSLPVVHFNNFDGSQDIRRAIQVLVNGSQLLVIWVPPDSSSCGRANNIIEQAIENIKADPDDLADAINEYGEDWETEIRGQLGGAGYCMLDLRIP